MNGSATPLTSDPDYREEVIRVASFILRRGKATRIYLSFPEIVENPIEVHPLHRLPFLTVEDRIVSNEWQRLNTYDLVARTSPEDYQVYAFAFFGLPVRDNLMLYRMDEHPTVSANRTPFFAGRWLRALEHGWRFRRRGIYGFFEKDAYQLSQFPQPANSARGGNVLQFKPR